MTPRQRLGVGDVKPRAADLTTFERRNEIRRHHGLAAADIDEVRASLRCREKPGIK